MVTLGRPQRENALSPIEVTELGMVILVSLLHSENKPLLMEVIPSGMVTAVSL
jgi:hypothetical protein